MISREPIVLDRVRKITGTFSWIDHRLLIDGFLAHMSALEILLYFFLVLVGDRQGMSFYHYDKICALLKIDADQLLTARARLIERSLIAFDGERYQVLQLPSQRVGTKPQPPQTSGQRSASREFQALRDLLQQIST
ncbi:MAG: hypothetical protein ACREOO_09495 [bacterium]